MQEAYSKMLERQELDRKNEFAARERRQQDFMNRMADGVIREMDDLLKHEDEMIKKYERERELKERKDEDDKNKKKQLKQADMVATLARQQEEKKKRETDRKTDFNEQAFMWQKERELWKEEDARIQEKIKKINKDN
jgi:hypothetical protein